LRCRTASYTDSW